MSDIRSDIDINTAVSVCQKVSEDLNRHLKILGYQISNCQGCIFNPECAGKMRLERLATGKCAYRTSN